MIRDYFELHDINDMKPKYSIYSLKRKKTKPATANKRPRTSDSNGKVEFGDQSSGSDFELNELHTR